MELIPSQQYVGKASMDTDSCLLLALVNTLWKDWRTRSGVGYRSLYSGQPIDPVSEWGDSR